jgi:aminoglycoside 6'-N-acetyltransferase
MSVTGRGDVKIRKMRDEPSEYDLVARWRSAPHVYEWWDPDEPPLTPAAAAAQYGPRVRGEEPTTPCIIELSGQPVGYLQFYRWDAWPEAARELGIGADPETFGIDVYIGEAELIGHGLGARIVDLVCEHLEQRCGASSIALATEVTNERAQRAYEKAGFRKTRIALDTDTRDGERVRCWLMERRRAETDGLDGGRSQP